MGFAFVADAMEMMILSILGPALRCTDWKISQYSQALLTTIVFLGKSSKSFVVDLLIFEISLMKVIYLIRYISSQNKIFRYN